MMEDVKTLTYKDFYWKAYKVLPNGHIILYKEADTLSGIKKLTNHTDCIIRKCK